LGKTILTTAITGAIHTPSMSPYLPKSPDEIIESAVGAHEAGASMVHIHARKNETGEPTSDLDILQYIVSGIKKRCGVVVGISTGGAIGMTFEERLASIPRLKPEIASCNAGTLNFNLSPLSEKITDPLFPWEKPFLESTYDGIFKNTFKGFEYSIKTMNENNTRAEFEVFDLGHINNLAYCVKKGLVKSPIFIQFVFGVLGGMPPSIENLVYVQRTAKSLLGDFEWSCVAPGSWMYTLGPVAAAMGGNVRVGMEDGLYLSKGVLAKSNAEQVTRMKEIVERMGHQVASSDEAREILQLKGIDNVNY
jgi:uncharacterized protein (DUF849 family)